MNRYSYFKNKNVLVTGHTGFIGYWLCRVLLQAGAKVAGYSIEGTDNRFSSEMMNIEGDVRDKICLSKSINDFTPEIVIHLAAQSRKEDAFKNPLYTYETNINGTIILLDIVRKSTITKSIVIASSIDIYADNNWEWGFREIDKTQGVDPLSDSKVCCETIVNTLKNHISIIIIVQQYL